MFLREATVISTAVLGFGFRWCDRFPAEEFARRARLAGLTHPSVWMLSVWKVDRIPHLSPERLVVSIATFLALVFGLDDLIGAARTNAWAASWLSTGSRFIRFIVRLIQESAMTLRIVIVVSVATILEAVFVIAGYFFWLVSVSGREWMLAIAIPLLLLGAVVAVVLGYNLRDYFASAQVSKFLHDHSEFLEMRVMEKIEAAISWAVEETERNSFRQTPTGLPSTPYEIRIPLPAVLGVISLAATLTLILSFVARTAWFLITGVLWLLVFAPAQALNAIAKRTGAENFIKVGKYVVLLLMSIYGLFHG